MTNKKLLLVVAIAMIFPVAIYTYYFFNDSEDSKSISSQLSSAKFIPEDTIKQKINTYQASQVKYQEKVNDLFYQAQKLSKKSWTALHDNEANPSFSITYNSDNQLQINENLKDYFSYYLNVLTNSTSLVESISRFLQSSENLPEPAKTQIINLFKKFILVELNLNDRIGEGMAEANQLIKQLQTTPANQTQTRDDILHQLQLHAQTIQQNKEITMLALGGKDILSLYKNTNDRANLELQASLINTDTKLAPNEKIPKLMETMGIAAKQPLDKNGGAARLAYSTIDASVLSRSKLSDAEKDQLRLAYFGQAYLDEYNKIYR